MDRTQATNCLAIRGFSGRSPGKRNSVSLACGAEIGDRLWQLQRRRQRDTGCSAADETGSGQQKYQSMRMRLLHRGSNRVTEWRNSAASRHKSELLIASYQRLISKLLISRGQPSITEGEERSRTSCRMPLERVRVTYGLDPRLEQGLGVPGKIQQAKDRSH